MTHAIERLAYAVLLPAVADLDTAQLEPLLERGCRSVLLGESRAEYLARSMSDDRIAYETPEVVVEAVGVLSGAAPDHLVVAVDHELVGTQRFAHLLSAKWRPGEEITPDKVRDLSRSAGEQLASLGVNVVLGPIVDVVRGHNPWLEGRNLGRDAATVAAAGCAMVEGLEASGIAAVAKHYPGHAIVDDDPAVAPAAVPTLIGGLDNIDEAPFAAVVASGVRGLMLGPTVIEAIDGVEAASCSAAVVRRARARLGFGGTLVSDDLDAVSILRGRPIGEAAVASLTAGVDLLLVSASVASECANAIVKAVTDGRLPPARLTSAAAQVGHLVREPAA